MKKTQSSPWFAILTGLLGLVTGYVVVIAQHSNSLTLSGTVRCAGSHVQQPSV